MSDQIKTTGIRLYVKMVQIALINYRTMYDKVRAPLGGEADEYKSIYKKLASRERTSWIEVTREECDYVFYWSCPENYK